jgi:predicted alpha/beta-fold hydrolase
MDALTVGLLLCLAIAICTAILYSTLVPSDTKNLGSLEHISTKNASYPPNIFPDHFYADLPDGRTHYYLIGPENGVRVTFVHGITATPSTYPAFINHLASKGYRILCFELYGRGYSDTPAAVYNESLYINQLSALLHHLQWNSTNIIGYSLGGAIACGFAHYFPQRVEQILFIAPAGLLKQLPNAQTAKLVQTPILGKLFMHTVGMKVLKRLSLSNHHLKADECENIVSIWLIYRKCLTRCKAISWRSILGLHGHMFRLFSILDSGLKILGQSTRVWSAHIKVK